MEATDDEQPEWLIGNVADISTALEGDHIVGSGDHGCYDVFETSEDVRLYMIKEIDGKESEGVLAKLDESWWYEALYIAWSIPPCYMGCSFLSQRDRRLRAAEAR